MYILLSQKVWMGKRREKEIIVEGAIDIGRVFVIFFYFSIKRNLSIIIN